MRGSVAVIQSRGNVLPRSSSRSSTARARSGSPRASNASTWNGSLRSGTMSSVPMASRCARMRVSVSSTARWSPAANSTNASAESSSAPHQRRPACSACSTIGRKVSLARSVLPRPASTNERKRNTIAHGPGPG